MRYFVANTSIPLKYVSSGNLISKQDFLHPRRIMDSNVLILVNEGILYINSAGVNHEVHPKQYIFLKAGEEHFGFKPSADKLSYFWVHFHISVEPDIYFEEKKLFENLSQVVDSKEQNIYIMPELGKIYMIEKVPLLYNQLLDLARHENPYSCQIANFALSVLVMEISQEYLDQQNKEKKNIPPSIARIMEWIQANCYQPLSVASIANEFGYNADYLSSLFKKTTKSTLTHYIHKSRIDIAKSMMLHYDISIKEAAYSCGFSDEKYFMKTFKTFENMTPTQYKQAFTKKRIN
ncbi:MAG: AraC family transcriptional regulator [Mobilitalea sp.]